MNLVEQWAEVLQQAVTNTETRTGIASNEWRVGGRRTKANPDGEDLNFWQSEGLRQAEVYKEWLETSGWQIYVLPDGRPAIEWDAEVSFGGSPVRLVIDCVYTNGSDLVVVDYKTGSRTPYGVEQLALYACAIERAFDSRPKWGAFYMSRKGQLGDLVDLTPWGTDYFDYMFESMNAQMATGFFAPTVGEHCGWCSFSNHCAAVGGKESSNYPINLKEEK
jgi:hypothetical protein